LALIPPIAINPPLLYNVRKTKGDCMENNKIAVKVKLTLNDYRDWSLERVFTTRFIIIICLILFFMALSAGFSFFSTSGAGNFSDNYFPFLAMLALFLILLPVSVYLNAKKSFESDRLIQEEQSYEFDDEGFDISSSYSKSRITWDKIYRVDADKKYICLYISKVKAFLLPKRFFSADGDIKALLNTIKGKIDKKNIIIK
jgi:hypothetical protein